ncbi:reverse transcriptase domain-containing protein [Tanacetum coccineum]|uniref:Reverse transcriptase domain-containing protein n=1 Tax=Tanacetum coccineum TaxID=301880 RepID=A0ABQ4Y3H3_9ASTR
MDLKQSEVTEAKSSIEEPLELELKDLPSHLEYAFLEENNKLPVIIAKGLKNDEKDALLKVLKSHKGPLLGKFTVKRFDPRFCTHKILMEDDYKPTVQSQRRVNPKIHEVPVQVFPKKGGITVVANEENELILTRQRKMKHFQPIHYASKTMIEAQIHYTTTKKEMLVVVYAFEKFQPYLVLSKSIVYTDHSANKISYNKQDVSRGVKELVCCTSRGNNTSSVADLVIFPKWMKQALPTNDARVVAKRSQNSRRTKNDRVKYEWDAKQGLVGNLKSSCMDIAKITRKRSKPDTGTNRVYKSRENAFKVNQSQHWSTLVNYQETKPFKIPKSLNG